MAGVTPNGWETTSFQTIINRMQENMKLEFGEDFAVTPDSVFGQTANIYAAEAKELWDLGLAITDTQNRDTAEGYYLDYLARLAGITRLDSSGAVGYLVFTGTVGSSIPLGFVVADDLGRNILTTESTVLNAANCYEASLSVYQVLPNSVYAITIEGVDYTYTTGADPTEAEILEGLEISIDSGSGFNSNVDGEEITITYQSYNNLLTVVKSPNLVLNTVASLVRAESALEGDIEVYQNTVTDLVSISAGIESVNNPEDFTKGRDVETDDDLRNRMIAREQSTGTATKPSIEASLAAITGVIDVLVLENPTLDFDTANGLEPKTYKPFVTGGDEDTIAQVLWETKPVTARMVGDINKFVTDHNGDVQSVKFSRKSVKYAWMEVSYSINDEELFPADGESRLKNSVVTAGQDMYDGEDFEPTKFYGALYKTSGVYIDSIKIAVMLDEASVPDTYTTDRISIGVVETLAFDVDRVILTNI